jgi:RND family efflux transporter MFP subunit
MDPVLVSFNVSQDQLTQVLQYQKSNTLEVDVRTDQQPKTRLRGELAAINNSVNAQTGTVELKAKVANPNLDLWPGQLVNVRLQLALESNRIVIPNSAVQMGQKGSYVYLAKAGKAVIQPITVARQTSHDTVISSGLKGDEDIIAVVPPGLTEGKAVKVANLREPHARQ